LPDYKNLDQTKKLDFRLYILNFFKNQNSSSQQSTHQVQAAVQLNTQNSQQVYPDMYSHPQPFKLHHSVPEQFQPIPSYQHQYHYPPHQDHYQSMQHNFNVPSSSVSTIPDLTVPEETQTKNQ